MGTFFAIAAVVALVFFIAYAATSGATGQSRKKALAQADETLDELFDGRPQVMYEVTFVGLPSEVVLEGANERGYRLVSSDSTTYGPRQLVFERVAD